ncbi:MAG: zinc ribbon domain-containing protein [Deltaproteobacteria bacterium]|nr:zinc ribbon domain-containing protein [Deltaproteobacteria bacterium]
MPIYEYTCKQCGNFEIMQRISEAPLKKCPTCGAKVSKLISRSTFHLKGSGWHMTDYGRNGPSSKTDDGKPATSDAKGNGASSSSTSSPASTKESAAKESSSTT